MGGEQKIPDDKTSSVARIVVLEPCWIFWCLKLAKVEIEVLNSSKSEN